MSDLPDELRRAKRGLVPASEFGLRVIATDLELAGSTELEGQTEPGESWKLTVPAKLLLKYLKKIDDSQVEIQPKNANWLKVTHGEASEAEFAGMGPDSYPEMPNVECCATLDSLSDAIPKALIAISTEESRFTLNGALLDGANGSSRMVSTDGHRLSCVPITYTGPAVRKLIPLRALIEVNRLKADSVSFGWDDQHLIFQHGERRIIARKLEGNFPDYERVLPREFDHTATLDPKPLLKIMDRVEVMTDERSHSSVWTVADGRLEVSSSLCETGKASGSIPAGGLNGTTWKCGFNLHYMRDALNLAGGAVDFRFSEPRITKCTLDDGTEKVVSETYEAAELTAAGWRYVVMPMRI